MDETEIPPSPGNPELESVPEEPGSAIACSGRKMRRADGLMDMALTAETLVCGFMPDDSDYMSTAVLVRKEILGKGEFGAVYRGMDMVRMETL